METKIQDGAIYYDYEVKLFSGKDNKDEYAFMALNKYTHPFPLDHIDL